MIKRIVMAMIAVLFVTSAEGWAQTKNDTINDLIKRAGITSLNAMDDGDYQKAIDARATQLKLIESNYGKIDSAYCKGLVFMGKCLVRLQRFSEATKTLEEAACIYGNNFSRTDYEYAVMLDNWSMYLALNKEYEKSMEKVDSSLAIFNTLPDMKLGDDMASVLVHVAESNYYLKKYKEATIYQIRALDQIRKVHSEHCATYISELGYLAEYQELNGEKDKAEKTKEKAARLQKEMDNGVVDFPDLSMVKDANDAHERRFDAARMADFLLTHYVTHEKMNDVARFLFTWVMQSPDCDVIVGEDEAKLLTEENGGIYHIAFEAAACKEAIEERTKDFTLSRYVGATAAMMEYYEANKKYTGKVSYLEKLMKMYKKSPDKVYKYLEEKYNKLMSMPRINGKDIKKEK